MDHISTTHDDATSEIIELKPGTKEFNQMNTRRFELIEKRVNGQLSAEEENEYLSLQTKILTATKKHFQLAPVPKIN